MPEDKREFTVRCRAIILHQDKLLVVKHAGIADYYALPGGHLEWGEDMKIGLKREIVEELGVEPQVGRLLYVHNFIDGTKYHSIEFFFEIANAAEYVDCHLLQRSHAHEIDEMCWVGREENVTLLPKQLADDFQKGDLISDKTRYIRG